MISFHVAFHWINPGGQQHGFGRSVLTGTGGRVDSDSLAEWEKMIAAKQEEDTGVKGVKVVLLSWQIIA